MKKNIAASLFTLTLVVLYFQACSNNLRFDGGSKDEKALSVPTPNNGNGDSYPGKLDYFAIRDVGNTCNRTANDGSSFPRKLIFRQKGAYSLVRDNCQDIAPLTLKSSDIQVDPSTQDLTYQNEKYKLEFNIAKYNLAIAACPGGSTVDLSKGNLFSNPYDLAAPAWQTHPEIPAVLSGSIEALPNYLIQVSDPNLRDSWRRVSQYPLLTPSTSYVMTFVLSKGSVDWGTISANEGNNRQFVVDVDLKNVTAVVQWANGGANPTVTSVRSYGTGVAVSVAFTTGAQTSGAAGDLGVAPYRQNANDILQVGDSIFAAAASLYECK